MDRRWLRDPDGWDPRTVNSMGPDVDVSTLDGLAVQLIGKQHTRAVAVTTSVLEIGLLALALTFWLAIGLPEQIGFMKPGPGWADVWFAATVVILFALGIAVVNLFRPTWTRFRVAGHALTDIASIAILAVSLLLGSWVVLVDPAQRHGRRAGTRRADQHDHPHLGRIDARPDGDQRRARGTPVRPHGARQLGGLNRHSPVAQCGP